MKAIPSVASPPASEVIQCNHCFGKVRVPSGIGAACGPCPFCRQQLVTQTWTGSLPPIPTMRTQVVSHFEASPQVQQVTAEVSRGEDQWNAKRFAPQSQIERAPTLIVQQPRHFVNRENTVEDVKFRAQPFERTGVVRLQPTHSSSTQGNRKFMQEPAVSVEAVVSGGGKKKGWGLTVLAAVLLAGLGAGGFFVVKAQQMGSDGESAAENRLVSDY